MRNTWNPFAASTMAFEAERVYRLVPAAADSSGGADMAWLNIILGLV